MNLVTVIVQEDGVCNTVVRPKSWFLFWPKAEADVDVVAIIIPTAQSFKTISGISLCCYFRGLS